MTTMLIKENIKPSKPPGPEGIFAYVSKGNKEELRLTQGNLFNKLVMLNDVPCIMETHFQNKG